MTGRTALSQCSFQAARRLISGSLKGKAPGFETIFLTGTGLHCLHLIQPAVSLQAPVLYLGLRNACMAPGSPEVHDESGCSFYTLAGE